MLRAPRRLSLEPCEDRSLPAGFVATADPPTPTVSTAHTATADTPAKATDSGYVSSASDAAEYATNGKPTTSPSAPQDKTPDPKTEYAAQKPTDTAKQTQAEYTQPETTEYAVSLPAAPPMPAGLSSPAAAAVVPAAIPNAVPVSTSVGAAKEVFVAPPVPDTAPAPPMLGGSAAIPLDDEPTEPRSGPRGGAEDQPAIPDTELPPIGPSTPSFPTLDDLDVHVDLAGWANSASRLLDGLDAIASPFDGESPWARLGYWVLAVGTVGVTVELTRQGLRTKLPKGEDVPALPVTR